VVKTADAAAVETRAAIALATAAPIVSGNLLIASQSGEFGYFSRSTDTMNQLDEKCLN
jgi:hypothetical protein